MIKLIQGILDFFYPLFNRILDKQTFYYAACGGGNLVLSWILFFLFYNILLDKQTIHLHFFEDLGITTKAVSAYTFSAFLCFILSFFIGFLLMKYVVFTSSKLKGRIQLFRYGLSALVSSFLSWVLLKIQIDVFDFFPSIANVISSSIVVLVSFLIQRYFTFK